MEDELVTFRKFVTKNEAQALKDKLEAHGIQANLVDNIPVFDASFSGNKMSDTYEVKIPAEDFDRANELTVEIAESEILEIPEDYYLFSFSIDELLAIVYSYNEWGEIDQTLARKILTDKGVEVDESKVEFIKKEALAEETKHVKVSTTLLIISYLLAFTSLYGIIFGYVILTSKKTLSTGEVIYAYDKEMRNHGRNILIMGAATALIFVLKITLLPPVEMSY